MTEWLTEMVQFFSERGTDLLIGGAILVGVIIFLVGVLKTAIFNRIPNKAVRKTVLALTSAALVAPGTLVLMLYEGIDLGRFWVMFAVHAVCTIVVYWLYENTHVRDLFNLIGSSAVKKIFGSIGTEKTPSQVYSEIKQDTKTAIKNTVHKYNEDDLKGL